jgi:uncharacterized protein (DUF779 family)
VDVTPRAVALLAKMVARHGPVVLHLADGPGATASPTCRPRRDAALEPDDVHLADVAGSPLYVAGHLRDGWDGRHITVGVVAGAGPRPSVEAAEGVRFLVRARPPATGGEDRRHARRHSAR